MRSLVFDSSVSSDDIEPIDFVSMPLTTVTSALRFRMATVVVVVVPLELFTLFVVNELCGGGGGGSAVGVSVLSSIGVVGSHDL